MLYLAGLEVYHLIWDFAAHRKSYDTNRIFSYYILPKNIIQLIKGFHLYNWQYNLIVNKKKSNNYQIFFIFSPLLINKRLLWYHTSPEIRSTLLQLCCCFCKVNKKIRNNYQIFFIFSTLLINKRFLWYHTSAEIRSTSLQLCCCFCKVNKKKSNNYQIFFIFRSLLIY